MSKYKLVHLNLGNVIGWPNWTLISTIRLPAGTDTTHYPPTPENADGMTIAELKAYALAEFEKAND
ncbi:MULTISPECIES: hypothetical protein [Pseudomonas syringae group]|uniref:hypothetical protein n=1 Tax=Pseudomonas syringae group TaxID=136849 RepID=UPI0011C4764E|nr:hypothetical protein [Pseudomonas syringae group genomosp. 3]